jgi:hypothetical protein
MVEKLSPGQGLWWRKYHRDRIYGGESITGTGFMVEKLSPGQDLWWRKYHRDRIYGGESITGTGFMVEKVSPGQYLWWRKYHRDRIFSEYFGFLLPVSFHLCSVIIYLSITGII